MSFALILWKKQKDQEEEKEKERLLNFIDKFGVKGGLKMKDKIENTIEKIEHPGAFNCCDEHTEVINNNPEKEFYNQGSAFYEEWYFKQVDKEKNLLSYHLGNDFCSQNIAEGKDMIDYIWNKYKADYERKNRLNKD